MDQPNDEHTMQIGNTYAAMTHVAHDLRQEGYSNEAVAEGMMQGAFYTLQGDRELFLKVLDRFRQDLNL